MDAGYVSRVLSFLDSEALITRKQRGRIESVDWPGLLRRWAMDAPFNQRGQVHRYLDPRGRDTLLPRLTKLEEPYAITASHVANALAPVAPLRLGMIWMRDVVVSASKLDLVPAETGANWLIMEPLDDLVFEGAAQRDGVWYTAVVQAVADLLTSPGRGPQEGDALIEWMKKNEDKWRR